MSAYHILDADYSENEPIIADKFVYKPLQIEAIQFDGTIECAVDILEWLGMEGGWKSSKCLEITRGKDTIYAYPNSWVSRELGESKNAIEDKNGQKWIIYVYTNSVFQQRFDPLNQ